MNIGTGMVRARIIAIEDADDARIASLRKQLREEKEAEETQPRPSFLARFRRRALVIR